MDYNSKSTLCVEGGDDYSYDDDNYDYDDDNYDYDEGHEEEPVDPAELFSEFDTDRDKSLSMDEIDVALEGADALRELRALAIKPFSIPGDNAFPIGGYFPAPANKSEGDMFRSYFKQAREELAVRLVERLFDSGSKNKWWQSFSKKKFMGKEMKD